MLFALFNAPICGSTKSGGLDWAIAVRDVMPDDICGDIKSDGYNVLAKNASTMITNKKSNFSNFFILYIKLL